MVYGIFKQIGMTGEGFICETGFLGEEAGLNALIPAVLLRGCRSCPDLRDITLRLDELYGASVSTLVRRVGDYQTTGFYCGFHGFHGTGRC